MSQFDRLVEQVEDYISAYKQNQNKTTTLPYTYTPGATILPYTYTPGVAPKTPQAAPQTFTRQTSPQAQSSPGYQNYPAYRILASMGMYPGQQYNFWEIARKWYQNNTQFSDKQIDTMLSKKQSAGQQAGYKSNSVTTLGYPQQFNSTSQFGGKVGGYYDVQENTIYINPYETNVNKIMQDILHELLHSIQPRQMFDDYRPGSSYKDYTALPVEIDTYLGELNRLIASKYQKLIKPGDEKEAEKYIRWFIDMKNTSEYPSMNDRASTALLRAVNKGKTAAEQDRIIKELAKKMVFLTSNQKPVSNIA